MVRKRRKIHPRTRSLVPLLQDLEQRLVLAPTGPAAVVGVNLNDNSPWNGDPIWVDVHNSFNDWWGPVGNPFTSVGGPPVNADGYPLAPGTILASLQNYPDGLYQLSYQGTGNVSFSGIGQLTGPITVSNGVSTGTVEINHQFGTNYLFMTVTGVSATATISNLHLYQPGYGTNPTQVFSNQMLQALRPFSTIRYLNFTQTNNSTIVDWSDRTPPTSLITTGPSGVPYEDMIALANESNTNMWINIPALANANYVQNLAQLIAANLDPGLSVYVEYSNETWNAAFQQYSQVQQLAASNPLVTMGSLGGIAQESAYMEIQDAAIFKQAFGANSSAVIPVFAGWAVNPNYQATALAWIQSTYGPPSNYIADLAIAPYIFLPSGVDVPGMTLNQLFAGLNENLNTTYVQSLESNAGLASSYGLGLVAYEGGQSMSAPGGLNYAVKAQAIGDPRMFQLYQAMMRDWITYAGSGSLFTAYALSGPGSDYGFWGMLPSVASAGSQEYDAFLSILYPPGDADLDGVVGPGDIQIVESNYGQTGDWWTQGVFDDSGTVDAASLNALRMNLNPTSLTLAQYAQLAVFGAPAASQTGNALEFDSQAVTYVSSLPWVSSFNGAGAVRRNASNTGGPIQIGGLRFSQGLGVFPSSQVVVNLNGQYNVFQSDVGINGWNSTGAVQFLVYGDGKLLYETSKITAWSGDVPISVNVTGVNQLALDVVAVGAVNSGDGADWAAARLISDTNYAGAAPYNVSYTVSKNGSILTTDTNPTTILRQVTQNGAYTVTATVSDSSGDSASASTVIDIGPQDPSTIYAIAGNGQVTLDWIPPWTSVAFDIYRGTSPTALALIASDLNATTYVDAGLTNGTIYYYAIAAADSNGNYGPLSPIFSAIPVQLVSGDTYASNLPFLGTSGVVTRDLSSFVPRGTTWNAPLRVGWTLYPKGLGMQANSMAAFSTNGAYQTFHALIGVDNSAPPNAQVTFMVRNGLGDTLYTSPVMTNSTAPISLNLNIAGAQELILYVTAANGSSTSVDDGDWANASLTPVGLTYLSSLPWASATNHVGPPQVNKSNDNPIFLWGGPMIMDGQEFVQGLGVSPYSRVTYNLNGAYSTLTFTAGFDFSAVNALPIAIQVAFQGGGYWSGEYTVGSAPVSVSIPIKGVSQLSLQIDDLAPLPGLEFYNQFVDWGLLELWSSSSTAASTAAAVSGPSVTASSTLAQAAGPLGSQSSAGTPSAAAAAPFSGRPWFQVFPDPLKSRDSLEQALAILLVEPTRLKRHSANAFGNLVTSPSQLMVVPDRRRGS